MEKKEIHVIFWWENLSDNGRLEGREGGEIVMYDKEVGCDGERWEVAGTGLGWCLMVGFGIKYI